MEHSFDIRVSQAHADTALKRFILRSAGWGTLLAGLGCIGFVGYDLSDGKIGYMAVIFLTLLLLLLVVYIAAFYVRRRQMKELLGILGDKPVSYRIDETEMSAQSELVSSTVKWSMIRTLWVDSDVVLVFYSRNGYTTIPTDQIPAEALEFLIRTVEQSGGKVSRKS